MSKKSRVLVADDDPTQLILAKGAIEAAGCAAVVAADGLKALELFRSEEPDLVILDVEMPGLSGFEVCERIRSGQTGADTPILIMTNRDDMKSIEQAYAVGATDFFSKLITWSLFTQRVRYALRAANAFAEVRLGRERLETAQRMARMAFWDWDILRGEFIWSEGSCDLFEGISQLPNPMLETVLAIAHVEDRPRLRTGLEECLQDGEAREFDHRVARADGSVRFANHFVQAGLGEDGVPIRIRGTLQDITDRKQAEEKIWQLANVDGLTGLSNRRVLKEHLGRSLERAERVGHLVGLLFLDLDHFKRINDTLGHAAGDALLREVAQRICACVRPTDRVDRAGGGFATTELSRLGGDEFSVILPHIDRPEQAASVARRILSCLEDPFSIGGSALAVTASVGISVYPTDGEDADALLMSADAAMYHAKESGRNNFQFYTDDLNQVVARRMKIESRLRACLACLDEPGLMLHYQPKVQAASGRIEGFEALLRWDDSELGPIGPNEAIPVAEDCGLILPLGEWILRTACAQARAWQDAGFEPVSVAVNVSRRQLIRGFPDIVERVLRETRLEAKYLMLEITETALSQDERLAGELLRSLKEVGVKLSLDDFGTGYSSLGYLRQFDLDELKIDRSFIADVWDDDEAATIVSSVISLARGLGLTVVAEGVETDIQQEFLQTRECDELQGYLIGRPVSASDCAQFLRRR